MKKTLEKFLGVWTFLSLFAFYFIFERIHSLLLFSECYIGGWWIYDCAPNTKFLEFLLLVILPTLEIIFGFRLWKKQNLFSKIFLIVSLAIVIFFLKGVMRPVYLR
jgi:hypothetical protein